MDIKQIIGHIPDSCKPNHADEIQIQLECDKGTDDCRRCGCGIIGIIEVLPLLLGWIADRSEPHTAADDVSGNQAEQSCIKNIIHQQIIRMERDIKRSTEPCKAF